MADLNLNFMHPRYGTVLNVDIDASTTVEETIAHLLRSGFVPQHSQGYRLAKGEQVFPLAPTLADLDIESGDIIRIEPKELLEPGLKVHIKHPHRGLMFSLSIEEGMRAQEVIDHLLDRGFIQPKEAGYALHIRDGLMLEGDAVLSEAGLREEDFVRIIDRSAPDAPAWEAALQRLEQRLEELEAKQLQPEALQAFLAEQQKAQQSQLQETLLQFFPSLSTDEIPELKQQAPRRKTAVAYEPIHHLLDSMRQEAGMEPALRIRAWSPLSYLFYALLAIGLGVTLFFLIRFFQ